MRRVRRQLLQHHRVRVLHLCLYRVWLGGLAASGWCFAMAIISDLSLLVAVCVCHCAFCYPSIAKAEEERKYMKKTALPKALRKA